MDRFLARWREHWFAPAVFALHAAITLWVTLHHEAWFDETDSWLLMRDGGVSTMLASTSRMGTPVLWNLAIWPFAAAGAPYLAQQLLNLAFEWGAMWLFLTRAPLPRWLKALFAFSYYAAFEYAALARPYALLMLLLFTVAASWKKREEHPLRLAIAVALLANATAHGLMIASMAGLVLLMEAVDRRRLRAPGSALAFTVMLAGGVASLIQLWPRSGGQTIVGWVVEIDTLWYVLCEAFFYDSRIDVALVPALIVLFLVMASLSRNAVPFFFFAGSLIQLLFLFTFLWIGGARHTGLVLLLVLAAMWIAESYGPATGWRSIAHRAAITGLALGCAWGVPAAVSAWRNETLFAYSGSREMATYLREQRLDEAEIVGESSGGAAPVIAYLPHKKRFWYPAYNQYGSFKRWGSQGDRALSLTVDEAIDRARRHFDGRRWLFMNMGELPRAEDRGFRLLYKTHVPIWEKTSENYWLYEAVNPVPSQRGAVPAPSTGS